jgi:hypothetical protein
MKEEATIHTSMILFSGLKRIPQSDKEAHNQSRFKNYWGDSFWLFHSSRSLDKLKNHY